MPDGVVQGQQIGLSICRKKDEFIYKSRKGSTFERPPRFRRAPNVFLYETCYVTELSLLKPDNSLDDESRAATVAACWK